MKLIEITSAPNQFLQTTEEITSWLKKYTIKKYTINPDLTIDVNGNVDFVNKKLTYIPVKFNKVSGYFYCYNNYLTTLDFAPSFVGGHFSCGNNNLTNLHNIHKIIKQLNGGFNCYNNPIIKSNILGLCFIKGLKQVILDLGLIDNIMKKHLHDINLCQEALLDAGYPELAQI